jgi:phosphatidylethanolamine-binding protein
MVIHFFEIKPTCLKSHTNTYKVLPADFEPSIALALTYASEKDGQTNVLLGNTIPVKLTTARPIFQVSTFERPSLSPTKTLAENKTYVLALTDPDATSRADPVKAQMCHCKLCITEGVRISLMKSGIATGVRLSKINATEGLQGGGDAAYALDMSISSGKLGAEAVEELIEYMAPAPPKKTGKHRYVFVLLEPEEGSGLKDDLAKPKDRAHWGYGKDGERPGVMEWAKDNKLTPVAANFFYAQHKKQ